LRDGILNHVTLSGVQGISRDHRASPCFKQNRAYFQYDCIFLEVSARKKEFHYDRKRQKCSYGTKHTVIPIQLILVYFCIITLFLWTCTLWVLLLKP